MKNSYLLILLSSLLITGCRTAFPDAQTPDDVYYSPEPAGDEYVRVETDEDRYLRMKVRNRRNWDELNDWYTYERWSFGMNQVFGTPFNPYYNWNVYHNPYWTVAATPRTTNRPRMSNLNSYQIPAGTTTQSGSNNNTYGNPKLNPVRTPSTNTSSGSRTIGGGLRDVFNSGNNSGGGGSPASRPSNSGSSSGQSAPIRKF